MALFDDPNAPKTLADVLGTQAADASTGLEDQYAQSRRRLIGQQAHAGRLTSGVANYPMGDLNAAEATDLGGVQSGLASSLGQVPTQDYADTQDFDRQRQLALLVASLSQPSDLEKAFGIAGGVANVAAKGAALYTAA